ncbi:hypothetical protein D3C80_2139230 [compost metagenome]
MLSVYLNYEKYNPEELRNHAVSNYSDDVVSGNMIDIYKATINNNKHAEKSPRI